MKNRTDQHIRANDDHKSNESRATADLFRYHSQELSDCGGGFAFDPGELLGAHGIYAAGKLRAAFDGGCSLFLCRYQNTFVGCFSLHPTADGATLDHLAVLPPYRHLGLGKNWWLMPPIMQRTTWEHKNPNRHCRRKHGAESLVSVPGVHPHRHKTI